MKIELPKEITNRIAYAYTEMICLGTGEFILSDEDKKTIIDLIRAQSESDVKPHSQNNT